MNRLCGEEGIGLVELVVALALTAVISGIAYAGLGSFAATSKAVDDRAVAMDTTRTALERLVRDLRAANPIDALPTGTAVSTYDTSVAFSVHCADAGIGTCAGDGLRPVRYQVVTSELRRFEGTTSGSLLAPTGHESVPLGQRAGAVVNGAGEPVFTYYDASGDALPTTGPGAVTSIRIRDCARAVQVRLLVVAQDGDPDSTVDLRTRVDLRNFHEVSSCAA